MTPFPHLHPPGCWLVVSQFHQFLSSDQPFEDGAVVLEKDIEASEVIDDFSRAILLGTSQVRIFTGWWQLKNFGEFSPRTLGKISNLTREYFSNGFKKTNQLIFGDSNSGDSEPLGCWLAKFGGTRLVRLHRHPKSF